MLSNPLRRDPTRTVMLRRRFMAEFNKRFLALKSKVLKLVVEEDALGLAPKTPFTWNFDPNQPRHPKGHPEGGQWKGSQSLSGQPGEDVGSEPRERTDREIHHAGVSVLVKDEVAKWGYVGEVNVLDQDGPEFERGGVKWREGGNCVLESGKVTIHSGTAGEGIEAVRRLTTHELMHGTWEKVFQESEEGRRKLYEPAPTRSGLKLKYDGSPYPEYAHEAPTFARVAKYYELERDRLRKDDGITEYSKAYWRDFEEGKVTYHIAVHETLAEIAAIHETTGEIQGSKVYKDLYKVVRDEYRVLTGQQKTRKGPGARLVANEVKYVDHYLYLDVNLNPTTPAKASYLKYWRADGTYGWATRSSGITANTRWAFRSSTEKLDAFKQWLSGVVEEDFLGKPTEESWMERYIRAGYDAGRRRAFEAINSEALSEDLSFYNGRRSEFLADSFLRPVSEERVNLLAARAYEDLRGVTTQMALAMGRALVDGMIRGDSPRVVARELNRAVEGIGRKRALMIARTETVRAHNEGQLDALERMGVTHVGVAVEWTVSGIGTTIKGNPSPCKVCAPLAGMVLKTEEAHGLIPRHPNCMCSFIPANVGEKTDKQLRTRARINKAIEASLKAAKPKKESLTDYRKRAKWPGAKVKIDKNRPKGIV